VVSISFQAFGNLVRGFSFLAFRVVEYYGGFADSAQPIIAEHVSAETMIGFHREGLETGNVLFYSNRDADVHHAPELVKQT